MQPYRMTSCARTVPRVRVCRPCAPNTAAGPLTNSARNLSAFYPVSSSWHTPAPTAYYNGTGTGTDLFRLIDYAFNNTFPTFAFAPATNGIRSAPTTRFEINEVGNEYILHGEVPGLESKDLNVEFIDERTLRIRGSYESESTNDTSSAGDSAQIESEPNKSTTTVNEKETYRKASVSDAAAETDGDYVDVASPAAEPEPQPEREAEAEPESSSSASANETQTQKFSFERTFQFPAHEINQDAVRATLKNGVLDIIVPKLVRRAGEGVRKIPVS